MKGIPFHCIIFQVKTYNTITHITKPDPKPKAQTLSISKSYLFYKQNTEHTHVRCKAACYLVKILNEMKKSNI